jgi:molybdopterin converting factor subunit 1
MHKVKVLLFATLREIVGEKVIELEIPISFTVDQVLGFLIKRYPDLGRVKDAMIVAINREFAASEKVIPENAEIALFPPVSGG